MKPFRLGPASSAATALDLEKALFAGVPGTLDGTVDFDTLTALPPPVARYFRHVLTAGQPPRRGHRS